jgi:hypothetical protein
MRNSRGGLRWQEATLNGGQVVLDDLVREKVPHAFSLAPQIQFEIASSYTGQRKD